MNSAPEPADRMNEDHVQRRVVSGLAWESSTKLALQVLGWVSTIYVARILGPEDYGIVAVSGIFTLLIQILADYGLTSGLVTRTEVSDFEIRATAWFNLYLSAVLYGLLYLAAPWIALAYELPVLADVLRVAGLAVFVTAARAVPMALVLRTLDFRFRALAEMAGQGVQAIGILALALAGFGVWSLVWAYLAGQAVTTAFFLTRARYGAPVFTLAPVRDLLVFGARVTTSRTLNFAIGITDMVVVSWIVGPRAAGVYLMAQNLANMPLDKVGAIVNRVSFPAVARLQDDPARVRSYFLTAHFWLFALCAPVAVGGALVAPELVELLFTDAWAETGTVLALLCFAAAFRLSGMMMPPVLEALRHAEFLVKYSLLSAVLQIPAFVIGAWFAGVQGVAYAWAAVSPVLWAVLLHHTLGRLGLRPGQFAGSIASLLIALVALAAAAVLADRSLAAEPVWLRLAGEVLAGAAAYLLVLAVLVPIPRWRQARDAVGSLRRGPLSAATDP